MPPNPDITRNDFFNSGDGDTAKGSSFFEKKNQKTFTSLGRAYPSKAEAKHPKVFCFFFSKKKPFLRFLDRGAQPISAITVFSKKRPACLLTPAAQTK